MCVCVCVCVCACTGCDPNATEGDTEAYVKAMYMSSNALVDQTSRDSDPSFECRESVDAVLTALQRIQTGMEVSLASESLYWLTFNGTVLTMQLSTSLMVAGYPSEV